MARFLEVDESGKSLQVYEDPSGKVVGFASTAVPHDGYVYVDGLQMISLASSSYDEERP